MARDWAEKKMRRRLTQSRKQQGIGWKRQRPDAESAPDRGHPHKVSKKVVRRRAIVVRAVLIDLSGVKRA